MPIKFRCQHCRQFLGISRSKAGELVDCPTCGRTLRVPKLDGTLEPVPAPKLDLQDSSLAGALDALAMIGQDDGQSGDEANGDQALPDVAVKPMPAKVVAPVPAPQPIVIDAPLPPEPVVREAPPPKPAVEPAGTISSMDELAGMAKPANAKSFAAPEKSPVRSASAFDALKDRVVIATLVVVTGIATTAGFFIGRSGQESVEVPVQDGEQVKRAVTPQVAEKPEGTKVAVIGQVTYRSSDDRRPADVGARILVIPVKRKGRATVAIAGFWSNADKTDLAISLAGLREMGGDAAIADKDGRYKIHLPPSDGNYHVLVISRFHRREPDSLLTATDTTLLSQYFDRPGAMIKQLSYKRDRVHFNGSTPETYNHAFE